MATSKIVLYKSNDRGNNTYPLALRITKDRKPRYIFLGVTISAKDWNEIDCRVRKSHPNAKRINNLILKKLTAADDLILESESNEKEISASQIRKQLKGDNKIGSFFVIAENYCADLVKREKFKDALTMRSKINNFRAFLKGEDVSFPEITPPLLEKFKIYLKAVRNNNPRTIVNHLIMVRTIFNRAIREGIVDIKYYPFAGEKIKIRIPQGLKIGLEAKEILSIENLKLPVDSPIAHTRRVWLFSFYFAGMRISDVLKTRWSDFADGRLYYKMGKNDKPVSVKIPEKVEKILAYYEKQKVADSDYIFPDLKTADPKDPKDLYIKTNTASKTLNKYLKRIASLAGIKKNLSNHIARHSFGNIAGDKITPQMLQKLYRHSDIRTTMGYQANFIHKDADEALDAVINF